MATLNQLLNKAAELKEARDRKDVVQKQNDDATAAKTATAAEIAALNTLISTLKADIKTIAAELV